MNTVLILADDLTGTNDTGAAIQKLGWETCSVVAPTAQVEGLDDYDCVSVNLDSRSMKPQQAGMITTETARWFSAWNRKLCSKRIDSTLRGNLGAETDALREVLTEKTGKDWLAMIVPAFHYTTGKASPKERVPFTASDCLL